MGKRLIMFYGTECRKACKEMEPLVVRLEKEEKVKVVKLEVWHNHENANLLDSLDKGGCGAVPFFYNEKTGKSICGAVSYNELRSWAKS